MSSHIKILTLMFLLREKQCVSLAHHKEFGDTILDGFEALVEIYKRTDDSRQLPTEHKQK